MHHTISKHLWWTSLAALLMMMLLPLAQAETHDIRPVPIMEGTIDYVHVAQRTVVFMDSVFGVTNNADIRSANGFAISLGQIKPNTRVKIHFAGKSTAGRPMIDKIFIVK